MSDLYKQFVNAGRKAQSLTTSVARPERANFADLETAISKIVEAYPHVQPDFEQGEKSGKGRDGRPVKLAFFRLPAAANGGKNGTIVLYGKSMEALFTNVPAIDLA